MKISRSDFVWLLTLIVFDFTKIANSIFKNAYTMVNLTLWVSNTAYFMIMKMFHDQWIGQMDDTLMNNSLKGESSYQRIILGISFGLNLDVRPSFL